MILMKKKGTFSRHKQPKKVESIQLKKAVSLQNKNTALYNFLSWLLIFLVALSPHNRTTSASQ